MIELYQKYTETDDVVSSKNVIDFAVDKFFNLEGGSERVILQAFLDEFRDDMSVNSLSKTFFVNKISKKNIGRYFRLAQAITPAEGKLTDASVMLYCILLGKEHLFLGRNSVHVVSLHIVGL